MGKTVHEKMIPNNEKRLRKRNNQGQFISSNENKHKCNPQDKNQSMCKGKMILRTRHTKTRGEFSSLRKKIWLSFIHYPYDKLVTM